MGIFKKKIWSYIAVYIALCMLILLIFGWLIYINLFVLIAAWIINTLIYVALAIQFNKSDN